MSRAAFYVKCASGEVSHWRSVVRHIRERRGLDPSTGGAVSWQTLGALSVLTGMIFAGCGDPSGPNDLDGLIGSWAWVESSGGIAGMTYTPSSTGETITLRFVSEQMVELIRDGRLERSVRFATAPLEESGGFSVAYDEPLFGWDTQTGRLLGADTLLLADGCCDGFEYRFERVR